MNLKELESKNSKLGVNLSSLKVISISVAKRENDLTNRQANISTSHNFPILLAPQKLNLLTRISLESGLSFTTDIKIQAE